MAKTKKPTAQKRKPREEESNDKQQSQDLARLTEKAGCGQEAEGGEDAETDPKSRLEKSVASSKAAATVGRDLPLLLS